MDHEETPRELYSLPQFQELFLIKTAGCKVDVLNFRIVVDKVLNVPHCDFSGVIILFNE